MLNKNESLLQSVIMVWLKGLTGTVVTIITPSLLSEILQ